MDKLDQYLFRAIYDGSPEYFESIILEGANVNAVAPSNFSFYSLNADKIEVYKGLTPLVVAAHEDRFEHVRILIKHGSDINQLAIMESSDYKPCFATALHEAIIANSYKTAFKSARILIEQGIDINCVDSGGDTVLSELVRIYEKRFMPFINYLIDKGADINFQNRQGTSILMQSIHPGEDALDILRLLLERGADAMLTNRSGKTVFDIDYKNCQISIDLINSFHENKLMMKQLIDENKHNMPHDLVF